MTTDGAPPADHEQRLRRFLSAFLPADAADAALHEALENARYWRDHELDDLLVHAHVVLRARTAVPARTEAAAMIAEAGVEPGVAGEIVGISAEDAADAASSYEPGPRADGPDVEPHRAPPKPEPDPPPHGPEEAPPEPEQERDERREELPDPIAVTRSEPMAPPAGEPVGRPAASPPAEGDVAGGRSGHEPPEAFAVELRQSLRLEDMEDRQAPRGRRLVLVGVALVVFLGYLAIIAVGAIT